jgi:hypothetical protein
MTRLRFADRLAVFLSTMLFTGCAAHGAAFRETTPPSPKQDEAVLYVLRAYAEPKAWGATVSVDGEELTTLNQGGFTVALVKAGTRKLKTTWSLLSSQKDGELVLEVVAGQTYYVAVTGISRVTEKGANWNGPYVVFTVGSGMHPVNPERGPEMLENCCVLQASKPKTY